MDRSTSHPTGRHAMLLGAVAAIGLCGFLVADALVGALPAAAVYCYAGAFAHRPAGAVVVFPAVLGVAAMLCAAERRWLRT